MQLIREARNPDSEFVIIIVDRCRKLKRSLRTTAANPGEVMLERSRSTGPAPRSVRCNLRSLGLASIHPIVYVRSENINVDRAILDPPRRTIMGEPRACRDFDRSFPTRRRMLQVGALGTLGLSLPSALRAEAQSTLKIRAKSVIFLHQFGGVPQQDTFDMKPKAPAELRGEFKPIPSSLPGLDVCELLPRVSRIMHHVSVVRSVNHRPERTTRRRTIR